MNSVKKLIFLGWIGYGLGALVYAVLGTEYNRMLMFKEPIPDKALPGDVIRIEKVADEGSCRAKCYLEPNCVSINVGPGEVGGRKCELKNFTDESSSHSALEERKDYIHYAVENFCQNSHCPGKNSLCQVGFTDKGYRCVCRDGYKGDQCNDDIDECDDGSHNCDHPLNCENVPGSFHCVCKPDFINDGTKCEAAASAISPTASTSSPATLITIAKTSSTVSTTSSTDLTVFVTALTALPTDSTTSSTASTSSSTYSTISPTASTLSWAGSTASSTSLTQPTPSECRSYRSLSEADRARSYKGNVNKCDDALAKAWYRFTGAAGDRMADTFVPQGYCGTNAPGYLTGEHPTVAQGVVQRKVCFPWNDNKNCFWYYMIRVRNCGVFYVYELFKTPKCSLRYCGNNVQACIRGTGSLSGNCYMLFTNSETWNNSRAKCKTVGAELVKIESAEENSFIITRILSSAANYCWIGLNNQDKDNVWEWTDGSLLSNGDYSNWGNGFPNNAGGNQYCVEIIISSHGRWNYWNDRECNHSKWFVCKKDYVDK